MAKQQRPTPTQRPTQSTSRSQQLRSANDSAPRPRPTASGRPAPAPASSSPKISPVTIGLVAIVVLAVAGFAIFYNQQRTAAPAPVAKGEAPVSLSSKGIQQGVTAEGYAFKGNPNAKVVMEDFSDYQCPHCGTFATVVEPRIEEEFIKTGRVKFIFRDFQFLDRGSNNAPNPNGESHRAAHASHCAKDQNKFWEMHALVFQSQGKQANKGAYSDQNLEGFAQQLGLNLDQYRACMKDKAADINRIIERSMNDAKGKQVQGTPTFFINERKIEGYDFDTLKAAIELAEGQAK